jgi:hypothetical protein
MGTNKRLKMIISKKKVFTTGLRDEIPYSGVKFVNKW